MDYVNIFLTNLMRASSRALVPAALAVAGAILLAAAVRASDALPPGVQYASDQDPVRITGVTFSPAQPRRGDKVEAQVVCTSNAAAVTAQVGTVRVNVPKQAPGIFRTSLQIPELPFYSPHQTVVITAIRTDGATTKRTIAVDLH
jgi:hypothetical protein